MSDALKPCPFCGGQVDIEKTIDGRKWYGVVCRNTLNRGGSCAVSIRPSASEESAISRWNMRALDAKAVNSEIVKKDDATMWLRWALAIIKRDTPQVVGSWQFEQASKVADSAAPPQTTDTPPQ